jgi:class 3 adenylate cyclase
VNQERRLALRVALSGRIDKARIDRIVRNPRVLDEVPSGKVVSIMFMDIVGFSQISERLTPQQAFMDLKAVFDVMRSNVIKFGGMVDKTLGDGMLAYFGYGIDGHESTREHADAALLCAISIQRDILERNLASAKEGKAIYPMRIGINTSSVFIGNVGDADYFDFTVIGNGVNLAKRFESSCQHYSVMIGASTYDLLISKESFGVKLTRKLIPIKHSEAPFEAYECQPFEDRQVDILEVTEAYRRTLGIQRKDTRWSVPNDNEIYLESRFGRARVNDFSMSGLSVILPMYIGNGVGMDLVLLVPEEFHTQSIGSTLVLHVEVRWGRAVPLGYLHGVMITNLSSAQKEALLEIFRAMIRKKSAEDSAAS